MTDTMRRLAAYVLLAALFAGCATAQTVYYPQESDNRCFQATPAKLAITVGDEACRSSAYYQRIGSLLSFDFQDSTLGGVAAYMGYHIDFVDRDLETMVPAVVVDHTRSQLSPAQQYWHDQQMGVGGREKVLVSRFFAPKIVNYSSTAGNFTPGWRKLVYLPVQPGSAAELYGKISGAYILFNYFAGDRLADPFAAAGGDGHAISKNNQLILVPRDLSTQVKGAYRDSAFFAVYSGYVPDQKAVSYRLLNTLEAGFDVPADGSAKKYALPDACAQCHGHDAEFGNALTPAGDRSKDPRQGVFPFVRPNYLDTDQWYDAQRLDFVDLVGRLEPVYDGGVDRAAPRYRAAMDVIYALNETMSRQGAGAVRPSVSGVQTDAYQRAGAAKWLDLHRSDADRVTVYPPLARLFSTSAAHVDTARGELPLLMDKLSQYCFRCHSSIKFNVFDAGMLKTRGGELSGYIGAMPLGRTLRDPEAGCLSALLENTADPAPDGSVKILAACGTSHLMKGVSGWDSGVCLVLRDGGFADGAPIALDRCASDNHAEKLWRHEESSGFLRSASRPDKCLAVMPSYVQRSPSYRVSKTPFSGGEASYVGEPLVLTDCSATRSDARMTWKMDVQDKMVFIRSRQEHDFCLVDNAGGLCNNFSVPNGSFFIRSLEMTKGAALTAIP